MKKCIAVAVVLALATAGIVMAEVVPVAIQVSPHVIALNANCTWVTVHADIAFSAVDRETAVTLNGLPATSIFADDCGNLVAKFGFDAATAGLEPGQAAMVLTGACVDGDTFEGVEVVRVK